MLFSVVPYCFYKLNTVAIIKNLLILFSIPLYTNTFCSLNCVSDKEKSITFEKAQAELSWQLQELLLSN